MRRELPWRRSSCAAVLALAAATGACSSSEPPPPNPTAIQPAEGPEDREVAVLIRGEAFAPALVADLDDEGGSRLDVTFQVWLGENPLRNPLLRPDGTLTAVVPAGLDPRSYDLRVVDPAGREGTLAAAYTVLETGVARNLAFATAPQELPAGSCSATVALEIRDEAGALAAVEDAVRVNLAADPATGFAFFSDATCATAIPSVEIVATGSTATFFFRGTVPGTVRIGAAAVGLQPASQDATIRPVPPAALAITSAPQTLSAWACSAALVLETRDPSGNAAPVATPAAITLGAEPAAGFAFFADAACTAQVSATTIDAGASSATLFFRGTAPGTVMVTASAPGLAAASQPEQIEPAASGQLSFVSARQSVPVGTCSGAVVVESRDAQGAPIPVPSALTVPLSAVPDQGFGFFADAGCTTPATAATIAGGESGATFHFRGSVAGTVTITAAAAGFSPATQTETILVAGPAALAFATPPQSVSAGSCSSELAVEVLDASGAATTVTSELAVELAAVPAAAGLFSDATCSTQATGVRIAAGSSRAGFRFRTDAPGTVTITASTTDGLTATQDETVLPVGAGSLVFANGPLALDAGACGGPLVLEHHDASGAPAPPPAELVVAVAASPAGGFGLFADGSCATPAASVTIAVGSTSAQVHARGTIAGTVQVTASAAGVASASADVAIAPGPAATLSFGAVASPQLQDVAFPVGLQAEDAFGNLATGFAGTARLAVLPGGTVACASACTGPTETAAFAGGRWDGGASAGAPAGSARQLVATSGALTATSNAFDVLPPLVGGTPPVASLAAEPRAVLVGAAVTLDASASTDLETTAAQLEVSFDVDGTAAGAPPWTPWSTTKTRLNIYPVAGSYAPRVAVRDAAGNVAIAATAVEVVAAASDLCVVDTGAPTDDGASGCAGPFGPDGLLSLPEAIRITNGLAGKQTVTFSGPLRLAGLPELNVTDALDVVGGAGVVLDNSTLHAAAPLLVEGVEITALAAAMHSELGASLTLRDAYLHDGRGVWVYGELFLERVLVVNCGASNQSCVLQMGAGSRTVVRHSDFRDAPKNHLQANDSGAVALDIQSSTFVRAPTAILLGSTCPGFITVLHSTFHANESGILFSRTAGHVLQNNVFTAHSTMAVNCARTTFATRESNLFFGNASDGCAVGDPGNLAGDPLYVLESADDYRLQQASPAVDSATDVGADVNGPAPGNFLGAGPDRGGKESW